MCILNPCVILWCEPLVLGLPFSYRQISKADLQVVVISLSVYRARDREPPGATAVTLPQHDFIL